MEDKIVEHEDWQQVDFVNFRAWHWRQAGNLDLLPDPKGATGTVQAYVNWGRWIVECPIGHGDAVIVSRDHPYFICTVGGMRENDGNWYNVVFPAEKLEIEAELLKRVAVHPLKDARFRGWRPGETVKDLEDESLARPEILKADVLAEMRGVGVA